MKKLIVLLTALLMCLGGLALAEEERVWMEESCYVPQEDGTALLHLVIGKTGPAMTLDYVDADFYDADGNVIRDVSVMLQGSAMLTLPEGEGTMPVTLRVQPPEGVEIVEYSVKGAAGVDAAAGEIPHFIEAADGVFFMRGPEGLMLIAFEKAAEGIDPMYYTGYAVLYDESGAYLGNVFLPLGSGVYVEKNQLLNALERYIPRSMLLDVGMREDNTPATVLFSDIPMTGLPEGALPASGEVVICALPVQEDKALSIVSFSFDAADGQFVIHVSAMNVSAAAVLLEAVPYVVLQDGAGNVRILEGVTVTGPGRAFEPGETLDFTITGVLDAGFDPVACAFSIRCSPAE